MPPVLLELFSGTGSIGKAFKEIGWEVVSLDRNPKCSPTVCCDILSWDYKAYPKDYFDFVWASPDCTQYSIARTTAKTPRNFLLADSLVSKALEIIKYFACPYALENPKSGFLKTRDVVRGIPYVDTSYCMYGYGYRKATRIWSNIVEWLHLAPCCCQDAPCKHIVEHGRHPMSAQRGPMLRDKIRVKSCTDKCSLQQLHSIPHALCQAVAEAADILYGIKRTDEEIAASRRWPYIPLDEEEAEAILQ